ncbi:FAD-dependent oxidoreductase [Paenibacillus sp. J5C_2022]|uniref:FAD-dependent oxidoreductase n=1 Tax=Paenibacillus sp. J5C2022 TaxID=2977129 RepID=UPI0021CE7425|nr:FAD-dependent oxidoreductase [Paenibacillus sp. J5C2022]MCU6709608.1 FAD-dependent oxidoreductase [Paenibacillus sp. J5C2022]
MRYETVESDITVIGGGLAGVCAAVAAARLGSKVALIQNRPVLGGNSSSEVRVWVCGATAHGVHRNARETGIMGELFVENQYRNPEGNPYYWDLVVLEKVKAEPNIRLFLNTDVHEVEAEGDEDNRRIRSVTGWMMASERKITFRSEQYIDCTGDGLVGFLAGAKYRIGREARHEYNEAWAPEVGDDITLGSTILFYSRDEGRPVKYVPPSFAKDIAQTSIPIRRVIRSGDSGCHYWWIEWGGEHDTVHDNEKIRDELWSVIYGIWDYIKNSGQFDAGNMTLEWVGAVPGKREYRRFTGDYVLNQNDILAQREFHDRVAFGGWSIDLHPPGGMYAEESGSKHLHTNGIYHIPFRSLYSVNVSNMLMAGRNISASHVAFGTTRVMATCAVIGEAAGTGAALCVKRGVSPRVIAERHMEELQQTLLRQDAAVVGIAGNDSNDMARNAKLEASSWTRGIAVEKSDERQLLEHDFGIVFPVNHMTEVELLLDIAKPTTVEVELWSTERGENYVPHIRLAHASEAVEPGKKQWVSFQLGLDAESVRNAFLIVKSNPHVALHLSHKPMTGVLSFFHTGAARAAAALEEHDFNQLTVQWNARKHIRKPACLRVHGECNAYAPGIIIDGYKRPFGGPHMWVSEESGGEEWLMLSWEQTKTVSEIAITFNDDVDEDLINLHHHRTPFDTIPELVKDYRLEALVDGQWSLLLRVTDNRFRHRVHRLQQETKTSAIRLVMESTNGCPRYEVVEVRVYE